MAGNTQHISGVSTDNCSQAAVGTFNAPVYFGNNETLNNVLNSLPTATDAPFNAFQRQHDPTCLPNTRVDLLQKIYDWADGEHSSSIFWLSGLAGTGKSTIARTLVAKYSNTGGIAASFFFSRDGGDGGHLRHAGRFVTSIAVQLANNVQPLKRTICDAITEHSDIANRALREQWRHLILGPLSKSAGSRSQFRYILVVDALDECQDENNIRVILQLLAEAPSLETVRLRVFLTSRPEVPIRNGFTQMPDAKHQDFILHEISLSTVEHDIRTFLEHKLEHIAKEHCLGAALLDEQDVKRLVQSASGLFIWAATACRFIEEGRNFAASRLSIVLNADSVDDSTGGLSSDDSVEDDNHDDHALTPDQHLDNLYSTVIQNSVCKYKGRERKKWSRKLGKIMVTIAVLSSPLSMQSLRKLLDTTQDEMDQILNDLHAILDIPKDPTHALRLHHPSFRDFLLDRERCKVKYLEIDGKQAHDTLFTNCKRLLSDRLKPDVCGQKAPGTLVADVDSSRIEQYLPPEVRYACLYWIQHLQKSGNQLYDNGEAHQFLQKYLLYWLEALGWMGKTSEGILAILSLEAQISTEKSTALYTFLHDAKRFVLSNRTVIEQSPLQLYCSALVFAPEKSIVRKQFEADIPAWIQSKPKVQANWNNIIQTLEGHLAYVDSVAFSPNGKQVVSGSADNTVRIWDAAVGTQLQTLEGHSSRVHSVAFSLDGKQVVSGSHDETVRLWDAVTGTQLQKLIGHSYSVRSVAFSPDSKQVVSGSDDKTVRLWDTVTGTQLQTLKGHLGRVLSVAFSPDYKQVVSGSSDKTIRLWDAVIGTQLQTVKGHLAWVLSVAFSPDGKQVVSGSDDNTVRIWDAVTRTLQTLKHHSSKVYSVAFSPDGKQVVSGSEDKTVRLWDAVTGTQLKTLEGHSHVVCSVAFSPDGKQVVSGSDDKTVRIWDAVTRTLQTLKHHSSKVYSVAFSPDGKQVVSGSEDKTVRLWDAVTGTQLQTLEGHSSWVYSVAFSPDSKQVVSGSDDNTVRIWDAIARTQLQTLEGHSSRVYSVAFSLDGKQVVSGSHDKTVRLWEAVTGTQLQTFEGHSGLVHSVAFSPDGKQVVSGSYDKTVRLWDVLTGKQPQTLVGQSRVFSVAFSPDGKQVVSCSYDKTVRIWDAVTGTQLQTLEGHSGLVYSVAFSQDGKLLPPLLVSNEWIVEGGIKVLWLPLDYRSPSCIAVWNRNVVIGYVSGRICTLGFQKG